MICFNTGLTGRRLTALVITTANDRVNTACRRPTLYILVSQFPHHLSIIQACELNFDYLGHVHQTHVVTVTTTYSLAYIHTYNSLDILLAYCIIIILRPDYLSVFLINCACCCTELAYLSWCSEWKKPFFSDNISLRIKLFSADSFFRFFYRGWLYFLRCNYPFFVWKSCSFSVNCCLQST